MCLVPRHGRQPFIRFERICVPVFPLGFFTQTILEFLPEYILNYGMKTRMFKLLCCSEMIKYVIQIPLDSPASPFTESRPEF